MTCETCGTALKPGARFCGKCGAEVADETPLPAPLKIGGAETVPGPTAPAEVAEAPLLAPRGPMTIRTIALLCLAAVGVALIIAVIVVVSNLGHGSTAPASDDQPVGDAQVDGGSGSDGGGDGDGGTIDSGTDSGGGTVDPVAAPGNLVLPDAVGVDPSAYTVPGFRDGVWFVSPSGNLSCGIGATGGTVDFWGCAIAEKDWTFPSSSPSDFCYDSQVTCGDGIATRVGSNGGVPAPLLRGGAEFPDEAGMSLRTLPYGTSVSFGGITCVSLEAHVVCGDPATGHGFVISRNENAIY